MKKSVKLLFVCSIVFLMSMLFSVSASAHSVSMAETENNNTASNANAIQTCTCQEYVTNIGNSYISSSSDVDYYTFNAPRHGRLQISFASNKNVDYVCQILDSSQTVIKTITSGQTETIVTLKTQYLTTYYLKVYSPASLYSSSYRYSISMSYYLYATDHEWVLPLDEYYMYATSSCGYDEALKSYHLGSDFAKTGEITGAYIYSMCDGTVLSAGYSSSMGYYVIIESDDIDEHTGNPFTIRYMHMNSAPLVSAGQHVQAGTIIGYVGNTGQSTGAHLHIDINTGGYTTGNQIRADMESIVNVIDFFLFQFYYITGTNIY